MAGSTDIKSHEYKILSNIDDLIRLHRESDWLAERRRDALHQYSESKLPIRVSSLWRYTDPKTFEIEDYNLDPITSLIEEVGSSKNTFRNINLEGISAGCYIGDGFFRKTILDKGLAKYGVEVLDLHEASFSHKELVEQYLGSIVGPSFGRLEAFSYAAWNNGVFIYVPDKVQVEKPIHLLTSQSKPNSCKTSRLLVVLGEGASLTLIDEMGEGFDESESSTYANSVAEIFIGNGARIKYVPLQNLNQNTSFYFTQRAKLGSDAYLETVLVSLGSKASKVDCGSILNGPGAESNIFGLGVGNNKQHFDHHTLQNHIVGHTKSDLKFKIALNDSANSIYTGLIRIGENAPYSEAYQENRNLILSALANTETIPELEILNNEVRCTHGATVGKVDPQEVFYLRSRGIKNNEAINLIVEGFIEPIVKYVPDTIKERFNSVIIDKLGVYKNDR